MSKNNIRSFRYSDKVLEILMEQKGDSLNQKFENLVLFCFDQIPHRKKYLEDLEKQIVVKRNLLYDLDKKTRDVKLLCDELKTIEYYIRIASRRSKSISEDL